MNSAPPAPCGGSDPGADYVNRRDLERLKRHAMTQLQRLDYNLTLAPAGATARRRVSARKGIFASEEPSISSDVGT